MAHFVLAIPLDSSREVIIVKVKRDGMSRPETDKPIEKEV